MRSRQQSDNLEIGRAEDSTSPQAALLPVNSQRRSIAGRLVLLAVAVLLAPGCQLNRSFFQMDSNSRVPFFGVDLAPKWPRRSSSVDGVSRLQSDTAQQLEPTMPSDSPEPQKSLALPLSDTVVTTTATEGTPVETFR